MRLYQLFVLLVIALILCGPSTAQTEFALPPGQTSYVPLRVGSGKARPVYFLPARSRSPAPIVVMLDEWPGRGRQFNEDTRGLSDMLRGRGIAFALIAADRMGQDGMSQISQAMAVLHSRATDLQIDMSRIAVMGWGLGASFAALIATDPKAADAAGFEMRNLRAAILMSGECYDVKTCFTLASPREKSWYEKRLPADPAAREATSPIRHAALPNAASFYLHYDPKAKAHVEGEAMLKALSDAGQPVVTSSSVIRFDQGGVDRLDRERPNVNSATLIDYLIAQLGAQ